MRRFLSLTLLGLVLLAGFAGRPAAAHAQSGGTPVVQDIVPVTPSTPEADGSIIHEVQYGQTLWMLVEAYGVDRDELVRLNNLSGANPILFPGQKLIIRLAPTPTITPTFTSTLRPPTRTATLSPTPMTPQRAKPGRKPRQRASRRTRRWWKPAPASARGCAWAPSVHAKKPKKPLPR